MNRDQQWAEFLARLRQMYPGCELREAVGASNGPFMVEHGYRLGLFNIDGVDFSGKPVVLATNIMLPPQNVLSFAIMIAGGEAFQAGQRRDEVRQALGSPANKVRVYLHEQGIFMRQSDAWAIDPNDQAFGSAQHATEAWFADVERESDLDPVELAYVEYIDSLLAGTPLGRLGPGGVAVGGAALDPKTLDPMVLAQRIEALGAAYAPGVVDRYHVAMNHLQHKHFVLLTGISGTGKTLLAKAYAYAVLGISDLKLPAGDFHLIPVRPDWTEPAHLLGFLDAITDSYQRTRFLDAMLQARDNPHRPVFVCLDEMNLAQPEHYFADILSAMESQEPIELHRADPTKVGVPQNVPWPSNLYIAGTVNVDETTRPFSPKVLDRANVIDLSDVDVRGFATVVLPASIPGVAAVLDGPTVDVLEQLHDALAPHALHFGYRTIEELGRHLLFASGRGLLVGEALDLQIEQKILTKLRGSHEQEGMLAKLRTILDKLPVSRRTVERMQRELGDCDSFQYWT